MARIKRKPGQRIDRRMSPFQRAMREEVGDFDMAQAELDALRGAGTVSSPGRAFREDTGLEALEDEYSADISSTVSDPHDEEYLSMDEFLDLGTIDYRGPRQNTRPRRRARFHRMMRNPEDLDHFAPLKKRNRR